MVQHADLDHTGLTGVPAAGIPATLADAKGDLIVASAADTFIRRAVGSNGQVLTADSAETDGVKWATPSAGGVSSGTSFPGSPSTGDLYHRTDLDIPLWRYDGTRWLCTCVHVQPIGAVTNVSATSSEVFHPVRPEGYDVWLLDAIANMFAASGLSGSAYWTWEVYSYIAGSSTLRASPTNQSLTSAQHLRVAVNINALLGSTVGAVSSRVVKTSTPGNFSGGIMLTYRCVGP